MGNRIENQERELREYFAGIPAKPMPDALRGSIMATVRKAEQEKFSMRNEKWGLISVIVVSFLLLTAMIWGLFHYELIPDMSFDVDFRIPPLELQGIGMWLIVGVTGLLLLIGESLLADHFIGKRRRSKTL